MSASVFRERRGRRADFMEIFAERVATSAMTARGDKIVDSVSGREEGLGVRARRGATYGFGHTSDLAPASVLEVTRQALASLASPASHRATVVPETGGAPAEYPVDCGPADASGRPEDGWTEEDGTGDTRLRHAGLLRSVADLAGDGGDRLVSVSAVLRGERRVVRIADSAGGHAVHRTGRERLAVTAVVGPRTEPVAARASIGLNGLGARLGQADVRATVGEALRRARARASASPAPVGEMPVILAPGTGAVLIHEACGHGLEADHLARRSSVFHGLLGRRLGPAGLTLVDDASVDGAWGSYAYDDEGQPGRRTVLIEDGVLVDYLWDRSHARAEPGAVPANGRRQNYQCQPMPRMSNLLVLAGGTAPQDIIADTPHGIYVARLGDGRVNTATGAFVFAAKETYAIRRGRLCEPLADCSLIGTGPEVLREIDAIGTDFALGPPGICGKDGQALPVGYGQPTLRVRRGLRVGGTAL
ncbi:TldD/PmbA family protein [Streptomyces sp. SID9727]|uniref:TldD/PmbA family protein n=1 Tax=Streptomyces sp. SID9727 TaxID=2706114 RepID=UPI0013C5F3E2|nr:TldD/PmbA family protein [Streptomyces sp. SID9727]NEC66055.1 TldD/PmbA family protein [Streptomyces sp. SID9727]